MSLRDLHHSKNDKSCGDIFCEYFINNYVLFLRISDTFNYSCFSFILKFHIIHLIFYCLLFSNTPNIAIIIPTIAIPIKLYNTGKRPNCDKFQN